MDFLKNEISQLLKLDMMRMCFLDEEGTYTDLSAKNYHRFLNKLATFCFNSEVPKKNIKVLEGASPLPQKNSQNDVPLTGKSVSRRVFDDNSGMLFVNYP